jgi:hypothetical protein
MNSLAIGKFIHLQGRKLREFINRMLRLQLISRDIEDDFFRIDDLGELIKDIDSINIDYDKFIETIDKFIILSEMKENKYYDNADIKFPASVDNKTRLFNQLDKWKLVKHAKQTNTYKINEKGVQFMDTYKDLYHIITTYYEPYLMNQYGLNRRLDEFTISINDIALGINTLEKINAIAITHRIKMEISNNKYSVGRFLKLSIRKLNQCCKLAEGLAWITRMPQNDIYGIIINEDYERFEKIGVS